MTQYTPPPDPSTPAPTYRLYDSLSILIATFFGTPVTGTLLMALNYRRLGQSSAATKTTIIGVLGSILLLAIGFTLPQGLAEGGTFLGAAGLIAVYRAAKLLQRPAVEAHVDSGGELASRWKALGFGLIGLVVTFVPIVLLVMATQPSLGTPLAIGANDRIFYSGSATAADASALGFSLKSDGFFQDKGAAVLLKKNPTATILSFVVKTGAWDDESTVHTFESIARSVAPAIGGLPIKLRLLASNAAVKKEVDVQ